MNLRLRTILLPAALLAAGCLFETSEPGGDPFYSRSVEGLEPAALPAETRVSNGDSLDWTVTAVRKTLRGHEVRMLAFNGSVPGPALKVTQGDSVTIRIRNRCGVPVTLHPHGLRLPHAYDGNPGVSQDLIQDGEDFTYRLAFPDPGIFWYHSHFREDMSRALGLYGTIHVAPREKGYWNAVDREEVLIVNELRVDSVEGAAPYRRDGADHVMDGRFGNVFMVNGDTAYQLKVKRNEYVRFNAVNACNARVLNLVMNKHYMKVVGYDNGKGARSFPSAGEILAPGERVIYEVLFKDTGIVPIYHELPDRMMLLGTVKVEEDSVEGILGGNYMEEEGDSAMTAALEPFRTRLQSPPDKQILLTGTMEGHAMPMAKAAGLPLSKRAHGDWMGIDWYDTMAVMNQASNIRNTRWIIRDLATGKENHAIDWAFNKGDHPLIRVRSDSLAFHLMAHPIHFHGHRFLVLAENGIPNPNLVWRDTYLIGAGFKVDLLLEASNPGTWMVQCHISEHMEGHMMFHFRVKD